MSIRVNCPACRATYNLPDGLRDKRVRCKQCEETFLAKPSRSARTNDEAVPEARPVADAEEVAEAIQLEPRAVRVPPRSARRDEPPTRTRPSRRVSRDDTDDDLPPHRDATMAWIVGGSVGGVLLLVGLGLGLYFLLRSDRTPDTALVADPNAGVAQRPNPAPAVNPGIANIPHEDPGPQGLNGGNADAGNPNPPAPGVPNRPNRPQQPPRAQPKDEDVPAVAWQVQPDPLAEPVKLPDDVKGQIVLTSFDKNVLWPTTPSAFAVVLQAGPQGDVYEVWDCRTMKRTSRIPARLDIREPALSPDGKYLVGTKNATAKPTALVVAVADNKAGTIQVDDQGGSIHPIDFALASQILVAKQQGAEMRFSTWDINNGQKQHEFTSPFHGDQRHRALSPNRKYLAFQHGKTRRVVVYDLSSGNLAGELECPQPDNGNGHLDCRALAFSPDGKELSGLFGGFGQGDRLLSWETATGKLKCEHRFAKELAHEAQNSFFYKGRSLEWLTDNSGWCVYGQLLIDHDSGGMVWRIPAESMDGHARRLFGRSQMVMVKGGFNNERVVIESLPKDQIEVATQKARKGQDPTAALLPDAKQADWSGAKQLPAPVGLAEWKAQPDPAPAAKGKFASRPIPLRSKGGDIQQVLFSSPDVAQSAVLSLEPVGELSSRKQARVDRYDLVGGKHLGTADLFIVDAGGNNNLALTADLSPDASRLVVREPKDKRRVDVWGLADGKHLAGWEPYATEQEREVQWFAFIDQARVLTLSKAGKLVLWSVPDCKAIYAGGSLRGVALSPGRKYLAANNGIGYELYETATGERVGQLAAPRFHEVKAAAFRPDGQEVALLGMPTDGGFALVRSEVKRDGKFSDVRGTPLADQIEWCGPEYVLIGMTLFDLKLHAPIWQYMLAGSGRGAEGSPDGRHWFAVSRMPNEPALLAAQTLPDEGARRLLDDIAKGAVQTVLGPGGKVAVRLEGATPAKDPEEWRKRVLNSLNARLTQMKFQLAQGQTDVTLTIQVDPERDTGNTLEFRAMGVGRRAGITKVPEKEITCRLSLTDGQGKAFWEQKMPFRMPNPFVLHNVDDIEAYLHKSMWDGCAMYAGGAFLPTYVIRTPAGVQILPQTSQLTGDR